MEELIIHDEEFRDYMEKIDSLDNLIEGAYAGIVNQIRIVCADGITEGAFHDNLIMFLSSLDVMQGQLSYLTNRLHALTSEFLEQIEMVDTIRYA